MAAPIAKTVASEIFDVLNEYLDNGRLMSNFELQKLVRKAESVSLPKQYTCLTAIYSHAFKSQKAFENAVKCMESYSHEQADIVNTITALINANSFKSVVDISKKYPFILNYNKPLRDTYDSALYTLDLEYCEAIASKHNPTEDDFFLQHNHHQEFFNYDKALISRASKYFSHTFDSLVEVLKKHSTNTKSTTLSIDSAENQDYIELTVTTNNTNLDKVLDMEYDWFKKIAQFEITDNELCDISFSMEVKQ